MTHPTFLHSLESNQTLFDDMFNNLLSGLIVADSNYECVYINATAEQILSVSQQHLLHKNVIDILTPANYEKLLTQASEQSHTDDDPITHKKTKAQVKLALQNQFEHTKKMYQAFIHHDCTILGLSTQGIGAPLLVDYGVSPLETEAGFFYLIEIWAKDRESRIQQEQYQNHQHLITRQMIRSMAHEVKNPLAGILGASQLLEKNFNQIMKSDGIVRYINDTKAQKVANYLSIIMDETRRLNNLVTQLLGAPNLPNWQLINVHEPLQHVLTLAEIQNPNISLVRDFDLSLPEITADKDQLVQVFMNIVNNAIQALNENDIVSPSITVKTRIQHQQTIADIRHKSVLRVDFIDNGLGIDSELLPQIFYPLVTGRANGTGLGLALAHDIIQRHQGQISVTSQPGETLFTIFLPWQIRQITK